MPNFRTIFDIPKAFSFSYTDSIMLCGSCFVENIGKKLQNTCFNVMINPFGILFNPISLAESLKFIVEKKQFVENDLVFHDGLFHSFSHHSCFSHPDSLTCLHQINESINQAHNFLKNANVLILTLGTAWIYQYNILQNRIVASCHKFPQNLFSKKLLSTHLIVQQLITLFELLHNFNPNLKIILTISPVRHIKDGFIENQQSKATLILSVKQLVNKTLYSSYFPVYELFMDDLRDYRFYAFDMLHPSEAAIEYIWKRFYETFLDEEMQIALIEAEKIYIASQHRPFHSDAEAYKKFCDSNFKKAKKMAKQFPYAQFKTLADFFLAKLQQ